MMITKIAFTKKSIDALKKLLLKMGRHYKLGNRSALEWVLDQYKESKPTDKTIASQFNTYRFSDYKAQVIDLLMRVCRVSVETMRILENL